MSQAPATEQEKSDAMGAYISCLHSAARKIDDGKSDAMSVALALKPLCVAEFRKSITTHSQGMNPEARRMFEDRIEARQLAFCTTVVLEERKMRGQSN
jgi:hypothetical protein